MSEQETIQTISQALRHYAQATTHRNKTAVMFGKLGKTGYQSLTFGQLDDVTNLLASHYEKEFDRQEAVRKNRNVGMYANSSPEYLLSLWALMKAGYVPLSLSPRNSTAALGYLAAKASTTVFIRGKEEHLVANSDALLRERTIDAVVDLITPETLQQMVDRVRAGDHGPQMYAESKLDQTGDAERVVLMLHSSGSTGAFPKLVQVPQRYLAALLQWDWLGDKDEVIYVIPPFYHMYGMSLGFQCLAHGTTLVMPAVPSWPPTTQMIVDNIVESKCNSLCLLPWLLENMTFEAQEGGDDRIFDLLASMREVNFASASLNKRAGDVLQKRGVVLRDGYGSSEAGIIASNQYNRTSEPCLSWNHIQILPYVRCRMEPYNDEPDLFRMIVQKDHPMLALGQRNTPSGDYDMNDVFQRVPCKPGRECYVIRGRADEVIVHSTGEKTSPMPIEAAIRANCAAVQVAVVVGQQRFNTALLVQLKPNVAPSKFVIEAVWKAAQIANRDAPQHSRIVKEMIYILGEGEAIPLTDKGSIRRKIAEELFKDKIDALYAGFTGMAGPSSKAETTLTNVEQIAGWLEKKLSEQLSVQYADVQAGGVRLKHDVSLFSQGFDSLLATQFYYQHLRPAFPDLKLPVNILYQYPEINKLAERLMQLLKGEASAANIGDQNNIREAEELYDKYLRLIEEEEASEKQKTKGEKRQVYERPSSESVVLTGCTGGLGVFLLRELLHNDRVQRVYALVRAGGKDSVKDKLAKALRGKLLDQSLADDEKLTIWGCQLDQPQLGLTDDQWSELTHHATAVVHNAWMLNFEATTKGFESSCIRPSYELMRLCRSHSLKQFVFVSSVSTALRAGGGVVKELPIHDQNMATMGYGQSKLLTERLAEQYANRFNVPVTIARVGQIAGDTINGTWNTSEHVSLMIKATETLKAMPNRYMKVDFLPIDVVAATMTTLLTDVHPPDATDNSGSPNTRVAHLVNPIELKWLDFLRILQSPDVGLDFRIISAEEWLSLLEESTPDPVANPIKKLQGYFTNLYAPQKKAETGEGSTELTFDTEHTRKLVPSMQYDLSPSYWSRIIDYWRSIGFLMSRH